MKFSEMPYARPDLDELKQQLQALTDQLKSAPDYASAHEAFLAQQKLSTHIDTLATLSSVRNSIDTRDKFYDAEEQFWNEAGPELRAYDDAWTAAMLESPFRKDFAAEYGDLMFVNAEIDRKAFSPAIVEELKQENQLVQDYQKLIAGAQIDFEGSTYTISQLSPFKNSPDDAVRLAAWKAEGGWYKAHQPELDEIYDKLVRLRDAMGRKLATTALPSSATTVWAETATRRKTSRSSALPWSNMSCRSQAPSIGSRPRASASPIP